MTTERTYLALIEESYRCWCEADPQLEMTRPEFAADYLFDFTTYDSEMSELFARKAVDVALTICDRKTFDYIKDDDNYRWFLVMVNMPFFQARLNWGSSIRGAFWDPGLSGGKQIFRLEGGKFWNNRQQVMEPLELSPDEWTAFLRAVSTFVNVTDQ